MQNRQRGALFTPFSENSADADLITQFVFGFPIISQRTAHKDSLGCPAYAPMGMGHRR